MAFAQPLRTRLLLSVLAVAATLSAPTYADPTAPQQLPTGQLLTPTAARGASFSQLNPGLPDNPSFTVGQTISEALSPDRNTLLVLTSGYNYVSDTKGALVPQDSNEYVFVFDVSSGAAVQKQVIQVPNTYVGITFTPDGQRFVVSGGGDDTLHLYALNGASWAESSISPIKLKHTATNALGNTGLGIAQYAMAQGVAVSADGTTAVVANRYNASVTVVSLATGAILHEIDMRPGKINKANAGVPGGEYPNSVAIVGNQTAYVSSERDREIVVIDLASATVTTRIPVSGNPNKMILDRAQDRLYVAVDNADVVAVIDTHANRLSHTIPTLAPDELVGRVKGYRGASPNALTLSPDERTLYVSNRGTNSIAVIDNDRGSARVRGLIPTGWYPSAVEVGAGNMLYVVNTRSVPGPNPGNCLGYQTVPCPVPNTPVQFVPNEYILNLSKGGFLSLPVPDGRELERLTAQVAKNNHLDTFRQQDEKMALLREKIKHVIYIVKENRTYDQMLGDIGRGNSDPSLAEFPYATTPNQHRLASEFVLLDNFYDPGEVSGNGWPWSTSGRESDAGAKMLPVNYAGRGGSYDWEGLNSDINVGLSGAARVAANPLLAVVPGLTDPDLLPGTGNIAAPDGPAGEVQQGYLWSAALRANLSVRNYGFLLDLVRYSSATGPAYLPPTLRTPYTAGPGGTPVQVAFSASPQLVALTDPYFRGFDTASPDFYREQEWEREFKGYEASGNLPSLSLVRLMEDHTGSFATAIDGVNTPEVQVADNDYAVGRLVDAVAHSRFASDTLIFVVEDDAQDGPDHVDAHRSTAYVVGPYVKQGALVSQHYTTVNMLRTITDVLGLDHLSLFDATQAPMTEVFDLEQSQWTYNAIPSSLLAGTKLPIPSGTQFASARVKPTHTAKYWAARTKDMDFEAEDKNDADDYNRMLWKGLMGKRPYPAVRSGIDLSNSQPANAQAGKVGQKVSAN